MDLFYSYLNYNYLCTIMTTDNKTPLMGQTIDELKETVRQLQMPAFTAGQIAKWLYEKGVGDIDEMTNLSKAKSGTLVFVKPGTPMLVSHANSRCAIKEVQRSSIHTPCSDSNSISMPHSYPVSRMRTASSCGIVR